MASLSHYDKQHLLKLIEQEDAVKRIFYEFARRVSVHLAAWREQSVPGVWLRNRGIEGKIERELVQLHDDLILNIEDHMRKAWGLSDRKTDDLVEGFIRDLAISETAKKGMFVQTEKALEGFLKRKENGFTISSKVWKIVGGAKENIEYYLASGISTGRPAALISRDIRQLLVEPDRSLRTVPLPVRDEKGNLVRMPLKDKNGNILKDKDGNPVTELKDANGKVIERGKLVRRLEYVNKDMEKYHPGRGVYRSSYKNALRLASTETNMAYHEADHERWLNLGFVTGVKVMRSPSAREACPICDPLVGVYPKEFKFLPWHPFCICQAVPEMLSGKEFVDYLLSGEAPSGKFIHSLPEKARKFIDERYEKIKNAPWVRDNVAFIAKGEK
jgi:hypothetical protein